MDIYDEFVKLLTHGNIDPESQQTTYCELKNITHMVFRLHEYPIHIPGPGHALPKPASENIRLLLRHINIDHYSLFRDISASCKYDPQAAERNLDLCKFIYRNFINGPIRTTGNQQSQEKFHQGTPQMLIYIPHEQLYCISSCVFLDWWKEENRHTSLEDITTVQYIKDNCYYDNFLWLSRNFNHGAPIISYSHVMDSIRNPRTGRIITDPDDESFYNDRMLLLLDFFDYPAMRNNHPISRRDIIDAYKYRHTEHYDTLVRKTYKIFLSGWNTRDVVSFFIELLQSCEIFRVGILLLLRLAEGRFAEISHIILYINFLDIITTASENKDIKNYLEKLKDDNDRHLVSLAHNAYLAKNDDLTNYMLSKSQNIKKFATNHLLYDFPWEKFHKNEKFAEYLRANRPTKIYVTAYRILSPWSPEWDYRLPYSS